MFLSAAAAATPDCDFLGIEILAKYARFVAARLATRNLANARAIHGDARAILSHVAGGQSVRAVHVYFPDPWWKARHKKRRVMNAGFLADVERMLVPGGHAALLDRRQEYFETALELIAGQHETRRARCPWSKSRPTTISTTAPISSAACELNSEPVYRSQFCKLAEREVRFSFEGGAETRFTPPQPSP